MKSRRRNSMTGDMINMGVGTLVGVGLMGASAEAVGTLPAGTAKTLAGTAVGLQGAALLGHNVGYAKRALSSKKKGDFW